MQFVSVPLQIGNTRIRRLENGDYYLAARSTDAERWLDQNLVRMPNELRWVPKPISPAPMESLKFAFEDKDVYIVGKGPSLDKISKVDFPDLESPVIAINDAIIKVESIKIPNRLFLLQQDVSLGELPIKYAGLLLNRGLVNFYLKFPERYVYSPEEFGYMNNSLSVETAIAIANKYGAKKFIFLAFDASMGGSLEYAECVGRPSSSGGKPERFLSHRERIVKAVNRKPYEFRKVVNHDT